MMRFALLVFYAAGTLAAPVFDERYPTVDVKEIKCSDTRFRQGTTFEYVYSGETINNVEGTTKQSTGIQLFTRVLITQLERCNFHMQLTDVNLRTKSMNEKAFEKNAESAAFQKSLEKNDIIFTMRGDTITTVRPHKTETTETLNIKRGILSTMQLDEGATSERDVNGLCEVKITQKDGLIVKTKSLSECTDRAQEEIGIQSASIKTASDLKPLNSRSTCTYSVEDGAITTVDCEENHLFRPFSAGYKSPSGAMTIVKQQMRYVGDIAYTAANFKYNSFLEGKLLTFDHTSDETKQIESLNEQVEVVMKRLIDQSHLSAKKTSAHEFTSLVMLFRKMSQNKMTTVWNKYFDCVTSQVCGPKDLNLKDLYRQYMLDAIAYCGTPSCISVVKDVTISGEIAGERANMFLQSIALVAKTTNSMIRDILDIAQQKPSRQVYLTLGTLISRHCAKSPAECDVQAGNAVIHAENFLERILGDCEGQEDHERVEQILITLKAIGNAKRPTNARSALIRCAKYSTHNNITMSAFDALRGMPCDARTLRELGQVIADENIDADKRIYAFQASMKCPTKDNLELLVHQYNMEKNKQLASFMWTYFTNLLESSDPDNKGARKLLATITQDTPLQETNLPMYQYSKNYEKSLYIDSLQSGGSVKANLVFHPDGFLPKSAMFDMTAKVMGVPVDLVETVVGIDGIEPLLENVFGPDGVLPKQFAFRMFNWTFTTEKLKEMVQKRVVNNRERREVKTTDDKPFINDIHDAINKKPSRPSGFMTLKVMGQEVRIMSYDDIYAMIDQIDNMNVIQLLLNFAKGGKKTFSKSMMFLEMTHTVPTGLGLPLKLKLTGSTVGTVELNGKFDIRSMLWGPAGLNINGFVKPSAVVEISGQMGIESKFVSTGLLVSSNMIVSNMMKGSINYKEGEILKINLDTPSDPVQLFHMSSTPYMYMNEKADMIEGVPRMIKKDNCLKSQLIGYGLCTSVRVPVAFRNYEAPYFPLSGPAHFGMSLIRGDEKLTTFQFLTTMTKISNGLEGVMEFSTPGAVYERKLSAKMLYTDIDNDKVLTLSTERFGKTGSIKFSYNSISHTTSVEARNNFFTTKDMVGRIVYFNQTSLVSQQYGVQVSAEYDWYKFQHVTKYVKKETGHTIESMTEYAPKKVISAVLQYNSAEKKLRAIFDMNQFKQSVEVSGKWEYTIGKKGLTLTAIHIPTGKTASLYVGYLVANDKKEIVTSLNIMGKTIKNILGWYKDGEKQTIKDFFLIGSKSAKFGASFENKKDMKELQFSADVFGKKATSTVLYTNQGAKKTIKVIAKVLGKQASAIFVITNMDAEKSIKITIDAAGKTAEATIGYYNTKDVTIFKIDGTLFGKKAELYWTIKKTGGYQSTFGGVFDKYVAGLRSVYNNADEKHKIVCSTVYYGTSDAEKVALAACIRYNILDTPTELHKQMSCSLEIPALKKKITILKDFTYQLGHINMAVKMIYNEKLLCTKTFDVLYKDWANTAVTCGFKAGRYTGGWKAYTQKEGGATDFGLLLHGMEKTVLFLNRYKEVRMADGIKANVTSSITINGKTLPVTTRIDYLIRKDEVASNFTVTIGKYSLKQRIGAWYGNNNYRIGFISEIIRGDESLFKVFTVNTATLTESKMAFDQRFGFSLRTRMFEYGWHIEYENQSYEMKRVHALTARVQYATNRMSTFTVILADSTKMTSVDIDVEYIPTKKVSHFIRYNKIKQQLDVSIEFLPLMFAKFMARLENRIGYELTTSANLEWKNFKRVIKIINSYINNEKVFMVSTNFASDISIGLRFNKQSPKSLTFTLTAFGNTAELIGVYKNMHLILKLVANKKNIFKVEGSYDQVSKSVRMFAVKGEKVIFDITTGYNKFMKAFNMAIAGVRQWGGIYVTTKNQKTIINFIIMKKGYAKVILNMKDKSLVIQFKSTISFLFKYIPNSKTISMTVKTKTNRFTLVATADWINKIAAIHGFFNKEKVGIKVFFLRKSLNIKLSAGAAFTVKTIFSYGDNKLNMVIQRIKKNKVIKEVSFKYVLSKKAIEYIFKWNTDTIKKIKDLILPFVKNTVKDLKALLYNAWKKTGKLIEISNEAKAKILSFINNIDKAFDDFDFVAARDVIGSFTLKALKKLSEVTVKALNSLATILDNVKDGMPETVQKLKGLIKDIKLMNINLDIKAKELIAKAKLLINRGREMTMEVREVLKVLKIDVDQNFGEIIDIVTNVTTNLMDATRPVVEKAITLLKDFRIRGKRMEDIVTMATAEGKKYMNMYIRKATVILNELKVKAIRKLLDLKVKIINSYDKATEYILKLRVPYTDQTVAQFIETIKLKINELKKMINTLDVKILIDNMKVKIMDYKINGKPITQHISDVQEKFTELKNKFKTLVIEYNQMIKDLPETTRETLHKLVTISREYIKDIDMYITGIQQYIEQITTFTKPLLKHLMLVKSSINTHFGPLYKNIVPNIIKMINDIKFLTIKPILVAELKKILDFFLPLLKPIVPLYRNILGQVRKLNVMGFKVGMMFDMQRNIVDRNIEVLVNKARTKMNKQIEILNIMVKQLKKTTPEKMIDTSIDTSVRICNEIVDYLNTMYSKKEVLAKKAIADVKAVYEKMKIQYKRMTSKSIDEVTEEILNRSSDNIIVTAGELSNLIKQLVAMDISDPIWKAWTDANFIGHLENYGINGKIRLAIKYAKKANITNIIFKTIASIQEFINISVEKSSVKALEMFSKLEVVFRYLKSIPKKDYDTWLRELTQFTISNKATVEKLLNVIYVTSRRRAFKAYETLQQIAKVDVNKLYKEYFTTAKQWYDIVAEKAQLVYSDVKQPTIDVYKHYRNIIIQFIKKQYLRFKTEYKKIYAEFKTKLGELKIKLEEQIKVFKEKLTLKFSEIKVNIEKMYAKFIAKYGDITWGEIAEKLEKFVWEQYKKTSEQIIMQYEKILKKTIALKENIEAKLLEMYRKTIAEYDKILATIKTKFDELKSYVNNKYKEIKPKVMEIYRKYEKMIKMTADKLIFKAKKMYIDAKAKAIDIYNENKDKTLKQIYNEIKKFIFGNYLKQKEYLKAMADKNFVKAKELVNEAKQRAVDLYKEVDIRMRAIIIPELMAEVESIINQTLRNTVIMAKEIKKAYTPHAILIKNAAKKYIEIIKVQIPVLFAKVKELLKLDLPKIKQMLKLTVTKLEKKIKNLIETIKKNDKYIKYVAILEEKLTKLKDIINEKVMELKRNPTLIKIKTDIEQRIEELKQLIKEKIDEIMTNPNVINMKKKVEATIKLLTARIVEYQAKLYPYVERFIELLEQIQISGKFTVKKLQKILKPYLDTAITKTRGILISVPRFGILAIQYFADAPEDAFWYGIEVWKEAAVGAYSYARTVTKQDVVDTWMLFVSFGEELITKSTDEWTKKTVKKLYYDAVKLYSEIRTQYVKLIAQGKGLPALIKAYYEKYLAILKVYLKNNFATLRTWTKEQIKEIKEYWEDCGCKAIVDNPIWRELADEVTNHELIALAKEIKGTVAVKMVELKDKLLQIYEEKKPMLEKEYAALKAKLLQIKTATLVLYKNSIMRYNWIINNAKKIFEETTIADLVAFVEKQYEKVLEKFAEAKMKFNELKVKFTDAVKVFYTKYRAIVTNMFSRAQRKVMELVEEIKGNLKPYYAKFMKLYNKYYPEMVTKYKELVAKIIAKYNTLREMAETEYRDIADKTIYLYNKYKSMTIEEIKKARETLINKWNESEIRSKLIAFKKMTIRETIEALKKLPTETKVYLTKMYKDLVVICNKFFAKVVEIYEKLIGKLEKSMRILRPYLIDVEIAYKWLENEIKETGTFIYKYYELNEKYNKIKAFIIAKTKKMITATKETLPMIPMILRKYADIYKKSATKYTEKYQKLVGVYARHAEEFARTNARRIRKAVINVGDETLRGIHRGLKLVDNFNIENVKAIVYNFLYNINDYVVISRKNGEISIKIFLPDIKPTLNYYANLIKQNTKKTLKQLKIKGKEMMKKIKIELDDIKVKADRLRVQIQKAIMRNTAEIRRDFNISYKVNKNIANRIYEVVKALVLRNYVLVEAQYNTMEKEAIVLMDKAVAMSKVYYNKFRVTYMNAYVKAEEMILDIANSPTPKDMFNKIVMYMREFYDILKKEGNGILKKYKPLIVPKLNKWKTELKSYLTKLERVYNQLWNGYPVKDVLKVYLNQLKEQSIAIMKAADETVGKITLFVIAATEKYYGYLKTAYEQIKAGIPVNEVLTPLLNKLKAVYSKVRNVITKSNFRRKICENNLRLCKLIDESLVVHKMLLTKYVEKIRAYLSIGKAQWDRVVRKLNKSVKDKNTREKYTATAMIMGNHILTFDNKLYNFVDFVKSRKGAASSCRYLLARDFQDKKFTLIKSDKAIIVETPDMAIKIRDDGQTKTTIGNKLINSLPVESGSSQCVRIDNLIMCHFKDQRMKITVDLKNFYTIISISGWYKGKSRGLLGTYNNEVHDDWRLPSNLITKNINEFANAYELTRNPKCQFKLNTDHSRDCTRPTSKKCKKYFASNDSPYAKFFNAVDPKPFNEVCKQDTRCKKITNNKMHCSVVAAYVAMLRTKGIWVSQSNECMADKSHEINEVWVQKPMKKELDIVVMVSKQQNMYKLRKRVATTMYQLHLLLKNEDKFKIRYALIGFGGAGIHEPAHTHPLRRGQTVFGYIFDLNKGIKSMSYEGKGISTNDGYHAILMASQLKFRTGAEKVFIMFNSQPHTSHESGPSFDETQYVLQNEANAPLFVFDTINFPKFGKQTGRVIGETERKLYTTKNQRGITSNNLELPASEFKTMVLLSKGGLFSNNALKNSKMAATSLRDAVLNWVIKDILVCKRCVLRDSWTGQSRPICVSDATAEC